MAASAASRGSAGAFLAIGLGAVAVIAAGIAEVGRGGSAAGGAFAEHATITTVSRILDKCRRIQ